MANKKRTAHSKASMNTTQVCRNSANQTMVRGTTTGSQMSMCQSRAELDEKTVQMCDEFIDELSDLEMQKEHAMYLKASHLIKLGRGEEAKSSLDKLIRMKRGAESPDSKGKLAEYHYMMGTI